MQVNEVMTRSAVLIHPDSPLHEAAERMKELDVGVLPVCENHRLVGMLTDRDITVRSVAAGHSPDTDRVRDAMTPEVIWCREDEDVSEAAWLMKGKQVRRLVVLNHDDHLTGIVSLGDLASDAGDEHLAGQVLQAVSGPAAPVR
jgi:CBS domain-containing protein